MSTNKARLKRIENRIKARAKPMYTFYTDESGCFFDKSPWKAGAQQLEREQVQSLINNTGVICFVVRYEPESAGDDFQKVLDL